MRSTKRERPIVERRRTNYEAQAALIPPLPFKQRHARVLMTLALVLSDIFSLLLAYGLALWLRICLAGDCDFLLFRYAFPVLILFVLVYTWHGLYPGVGLSPVQEMKQLFGATNFVFILLIALSFWEQRANQSAFFMLLTAWLLALVLVQLSRWLTRITGRKIGFWGEPVAVVGSGPLGQHITKYLQGRIRLGMLPVLTVDGKAKYEETPLVAINRSLIRTVILVIPEMSAEMQKRFLDDQRFSYHRRRGENYIPRIILVSPLGGWGSLGVRPIDLEGKLGLEIPNNLMQTLPRALKRGMDLGITCVGILLLSPVLALIAAAIALESHGGVFFKQKRIGRDGQNFLLWKFRSMHAGADKMLQDLLEANTELKAEWEASQKLKDDPRITRMGRILRKTSLDELPQLINVLKGEMSLVGPRPIVENESKRYQEIFEKYKKVRPGMTGLWQVSGRNDTTYNLRVQMDEYYIHNWSPWMDFYIILRTVLVVLSNKGAY